MSHESETAERRAARLVRCYPRAWRERYGEEFVQLLLDDIAERPQSISRTADVVRGGLLARLSSAGLAGEAFSAEQQRPASLTALIVAFSAFLVFGLAIWSQLTIGWQWAAPEASATATAMIVMSVVAAGFALLAVLAVVPVGWTLARVLIGGDRRGLRTPTAAGLAGLVVLVIGSVHFGHGWPGTGGHPWAGRDIVPGEIARISWAATLWVTSYWAHPGALASFPRSEIAWMIVSPIASLAVLIGTVKTVRRLPLSAGVVRYESWLGIVTVIAMTAFLAGAASWIVSGGSAPRGLFRSGAIDAAGVTLMSAALVVAFGAARRLAAVGPSRRATN